MRVVTLMVIALVKLSRFCLTQATRALFFIFFGVGFIIIFFKLKPLYFLQCVVLKVIIVQHVTLLRVHVLLRETFV